MVKLDKSTDEQLVKQLLHDRYSIQSLLGRKTGRRTFLAVDLATDLPVVIKLLLFSPDFTWNDLKLFEREAETLKALDHPAIPQYLDFFEVETELGKGFALVQSYIEARSLQEWVQAGCTFSENELKAIATELLTILDYLHSRQPSVIHRDIKPSNVLLRRCSDDSPSEVYLVDFGSVQTVAHGGTMTVVGTYGYMPPEQFGGRSLPASDLYGVGATLIYLATGQHPADLPQNNLQVEFAQLTTLSQPFTRWIEWLTEPSLSKRLVSAQEAIEYNFCQYFRPVANEAVTSLSNQNLSLKIRRPARSKIDLKATQTTLEITAPRKQIDYTFASGAKPVLVGCFIPVVLTFFLMSIVGIGGLLLSLVLSFILYAIYLSCLGRDARLQHVFSTSAASIHSTGIKFELEKHSIIATLHGSVGSYKAPIVFFRKELLSLSAGLSAVPEYRLNLNFRDSSSMVAIRGNRQEIQWLCDELTEWTGIQAQRWEPPSV